LVQCLALWSPLKVRRVFYSWLVSLTAFSLDLFSMSPSAVTDPTLNGELAIEGPANHSKQTSFHLDRHLYRTFPVIVSGKGNYLYTKDGRAVFDASSGAAVSCLGHGNERVMNAIRNQISAGIPYLASTFWSSDVVDELCKELISGADGKMSKVYLTGSGMSWEYDLSW
jgi:4-aminobutyrate aminotransferase-like enzyme